MSKSKYTSNKNINSPNTKKKRASSSFSTSPSQLIRKYGYKKVEMLEDHLQNALQQSFMTKNFQEVFSLKDKIQVLQIENDRHYEYQKNKLIKHLVKLMQEEAIKILKEFQVQSGKQMVDLHEKLNELKSELAEIQQEQYQRSVQQFENKEQSWHPSSQILRLEDQIEKLLAHEDYISASKVQTQLQKCKDQHLNRKYQQIQRQRKVAMKKLQQKHQKQANAMQTRFQGILNEQVKHQEKQLEELIGKLRIIVEKIERQLFCSTKFEDIMDQTLLRQKNRSLIKQTYAIELEQKLNNRKLFQTTRQQTVQNTKRQKKTDSKSQRSKNF